MKSASWIWLWVGFGFALLCVAWTAMFFFARQANVQSVPLAAPVGASAEGR